MLRPCRQSLTRVPTASCIHLHHHCQLLLKNWLTKLRGMWEVLLCGRKLYSTQSTESKYNIHRGTYALVCYDEHNSTGINVGGDFYRPVGHS